MRNPIRLKNLRLRFLPFIALGIVLLALRPARPEDFVLGLPPILLGTALRGWAAGHLVKTDVLTTSGPYAHLRHPLYLGSLLIGSGFALLVGGRTSLVVLAFAWSWFAWRYFPRKDRVECARLAVLYGDAFRRYREAVPGLWPRLRPWRAAGAAAGATAAARSASPPGWSLDRYSENNELGTLLAVTVTLAAFVGRVLAASGSTGIPS